MVPNCIEWCRMMPKGTKWYKEADKWCQMVANSTELYWMVHNDIKWYWMVPNCIKWCNDSEWYEMVTNGTEWCRMVPFTFNVSCLLFLAINWNPSPLLYVSYFFSTQASSRGPRTPRNIVIIFLHVSSNTGQYITRLKNEG